MKVPSLNPKLMSLAIRAYTLSFCLRNSAINNTNNPICISLDYIILCNTLLSPGLNNTYMHQFSLYYFIWYIVILFDLIHCWVLELTIPMCTSLDYIIFIWYIVESWTSHYYMHQFSLYYFIWYIVILFYLIHCWVLDVTIPIYSGVNWYANVNTNVEPMHHGLGYD